MSRDTSIFVIKPLPFENYSPHRDEPVMELKSTFMPSFLDQAMLLERSRNISELPVKLL